ncbi:MAG: SDR family oxidoreductase [Bacteroidota bacterium]
MESVAFITGANKGIGYEVARQLGKAGMKILLGARSRTRGSEALEKLRAEDIQVELILLDLADPQSIHRAVEDISHGYHHLDILVNNAALLLDEGTALTDVSNEMLVMTYLVNVLGPFRLIQACIPLLAPGGRVINVSSGAGVICGEIGGYAPLYSMSKTALNGLTRHWAYHLKSKKISVNAVCPGWVRTDMGGSSAPRSVEKGAETIVWLAKDAPATLTDKFFRDKAEISW